MKSFIKNFLLVSIFVFVSNEANACSSTSTISTASSSQFSFTSNNECLVIDSPGSITRGNSEAAINNSGPSYTGIEITNNGTVTIGAASAYGIYNFGSISSLVNNGSIISTTSGYGYGLVNYGNISLFNNTGTISTNGGYGINQNTNTITTLINTGTITGGAGGRDIQSNSGTIVTFDNLQGAGNSSGAVNFYGKLPTNYNIIISSQTVFGKLVGASLSGATNFGIYSGDVSGVAASTVSKGTYASVLSGLSTSNVGATRSGTYNGLNWTLALQSGSSTVWDLIFSGGSTADTQSSLASQARKLRGVFNANMASSNFANMNTYDCNLFDKNNMCISAGGRITTIDNPSSHHSAAAVVLGYKVSPNIRIGGFLDQSVNHNMPTGVDMSNKNPMMGAFAVWNQQVDGLGLQMKLANAYQDKDVTTTRDITGTSEAGTGKTNLNTQSYVGELSYAFNYQDSTIVRPYFAVRYTNIKQDGYTEDTTASVTAPLTYAKLSDRSTTALMDVKLNHALTPRTNLTASLGVEQDINHKTDQLTASGVAGLTSENFNNNIKRTRPVVSAGAYYAVAKNQRLSGEVYYQQLPFQSTGSATAYVNYMIGF
ncbi:MAG: hypothetical protein RL348_739 [Bacteroidota bacterium]